MYNFEEMINRIKRLKKEQKLSNEALSVLSGIPKGTLAKILGSETRDPQISNVIKISQALGVSADYVIFGKEEPRYDNNFLYMLSFLNSEGQNKVIDYIRDLINSGNYQSTALKSEHITHAVYRAARSVDHSEPRIEERTSEEMAKFRKATPVTSDEDL